MPDFVPPHSNPESLKPRTIIPLEGLMGIAAIEDSIAAVVEPSYDKEARMARDCVKELLRPIIQKRPFVGSFVDTELEIMADPYDRLLDCRERGFKMQTRTYPRTNSYSLEAAKLAVGLLFRSNLYSSSRRAVIGSTVSELFYLPLPRAPRYGSGVLGSGTIGLDDSSDILRTSPVRIKASSGHALSRYATMPLYSKTPMPASDSDTRRTG